MGGIILNNTGTRNCVTCGEEVPLDMKNCPYCGSVCEEAYKTSAEVSNPYGRREVEILIDELPFISLEKSQHPLNDEEQEEANQDELKSDETVNSSDGTNLKEPEKNIEPPTASYDENKLSNGFKTITTVLCTIIPGIGQLVGIIMGLVFMNSDNFDKKSFGKALLVSSVIIFFLSCVFWYLMAIALSNAPV